LFSVCQVAFCSQLVQAVIQQVVLLGELALLVMTP
jgi:hypothetical protein